jgi:ubiquinone/menaquinone biosynthesis C-methylase UbiE
MIRNQHVVHWAARYDLLVWLMTYGREQKFREQLLAPVALKPGESVLDVGCGTGSLAIAAKRQVGKGEVMGIDPSEEMIARARHKANKAGLDIRFDVGRAESLDLPDGSFDVVLSTVMLHHVPRAVRPDVVREMGRVLKPGGRILAIDFAGGGKRKSLAGFLHRNLLLKSNYLVALFEDAGLNVRDSGLVGKWDLQFVVAGLS